MKKKSPNDMVDELINLKKKTGGSYPSIQFSKSSSEFVINDLFNLIDHKKPKKAKSSPPVAEPIQTKIEPFTIFDPTIKVKLEES